MRSFEDEIARCVPGFHATGPLRRSRKSWLLAGESASGDPLWVKRLAKAGDHWRWYFEHEVALYEAFRATPPPVRVPKVEAIHLDHGLLVMERLGEPLAIDRRAEDTIAKILLDALFEASFALGGWKRGLELAPSKPSKRARTAMRRSLLEDPSRPLEWMTLGVEQCCDHGVLTPHAADLVKDALAGASLVFAHGDLLPRNVLMAGEGIALVDWECAGDYPLGWDRALLWVNVPALRPRLEGGRPFWACVAFALARELDFQRRPTSLTAALHDELRQVLRALG